MKISILGIGYVGLPLAVAFSKNHKVIGIDINNNRIDRLKLGEDDTKEIEASRLLQSLKNGLSLSNDILDAAEASVYIITVPTPINISKTPNLNPIINATKQVASVLKKDDIVVYESTVYPGVTEGICVPILEELSGFSFNTDFFVGYSPERINPGDKKHTITKITKVVSGSTPETLEQLAELYGSIIEAGIYKAPTIKTAEAAKVIENTQRDINIAFINELAVIFGKMGINTQEVLKAAGTKWNFLNFTPGLVGGHCIGVDPYYLAHKSQELGYTPEMILAGRRINDGMPTIIVNRIVKKFLQKNKSIHDSTALILGATFKENCPDLRNSKVVDLNRELMEFGFNVSIYDPEVDDKEFESEYDFKKLNTLEQTYDLVILAVAHREFITINPKDHLNDGGVVFDVKGIYSDPDFMYL